MYQLMGCWILIESNVTTTGGSHDLWQSFITDRSLRYTDDCYSYWYENKRSGDRISERIWII